MLLPKHYIVAARALLGWTQSDLHKASNICVTTIMKIETGKRSARADTNDAICKAFEANGIRFENDGLRLIDKSKVA